MTAQAVLRRKCGCGGTCGGCAKNAAPPIVHDVLRGSGQPLDAGTRAFFEPRFGRDLSGVRVHHDARAAESADAVDAAAYTVGSHIVLGAPSSTSSRELLAHELAHTIQQSSGDPHVSSLTIGATNDPEEAEADAAADRALSSVDCGSSLPLSKRRHAAALQRRPDRDSETRRDWTDAKPGEEAEPELPQAAKLEQNLESARAIHIEPVRDLLLSEVGHSAPIGARAFARSMAELRWELVAPDGRVVADDSAFLTFAGTSTVSAPVFFQLRREHVMRDRAFFMEGTYNLRAIGVGADGKPRRHATREFKVIGADLATGKAVQGQHGALTFTQYDKRPRKGNTPPGVEVRLEFKPKSSVDCMDVAFIQAVQGVTTGGWPASALTSQHQQLDARKTPLYWSIDQVEGARSPYYIRNTNASGETADSAGLGHSGHGGAKPLETTLYDWPAANVRGVRRFESCAVCRSGPSQGTVYGCATWGYETNAKDEITLLPRSFADAPSPSFRAASDEWNRWRTTFKSAQPYRLPDLKLRRKPKTGGLLGREAPRWLEQSLQALDRGEPIGGPAARRIARKWSRGDARFLLTSQRKARLIRELMSEGLTRADQWAVLGLLERSSQTDLLSIFGAGGVTHDELRGQFEGRPRKQLQLFYRRRYNKAFDDAIRASDVYPDTPEPEKPAGEDWPSGEKLADSEDAGAPNEYMVSVGERRLPQSRLPKQQPTRLRKELTQEDAIAAVEEVYGDYIGAKTRKRTHQTSVETEGFESALEKHHEGESSGTVRGFYEQESNTIFLNSGNTIPTTLLHETIHSFRHPDFLVWKSFREGVVEFLTRRVALRSRGRQLAIHEQNDADVEKVQQLVLLVGEEVLVRAFFQGKVAELRKAIAGRGQAGNFPYFEEPKP